MQVLAAEPSDYSYFNSNLLRTWAGPEHWKVKPKSKGRALDNVYPNLIHHLLLHSTKKVFICIKDLDFPSSI